MKRIKILVIDGGGARGIITTWLLSEIEKRTGKSCSELFDIVGGTSVGSLVAMSLVLPDNNGKPKYKASDLTSIFEQDVKEVFKTNIFRTIKSLGGLIRAKFTNKQLYSILEKRFDNHILSKSLINIIIPAYNVRTGDPLFFKSYKAKNDKSRDYYLKDIGACAAAPPSLIQIPWIKSLNGEKEIPLADGGMVAYNMPIVLLSEVKKLYPDAEEICLVQVGCGQPSLGINDKQIKKWGFIQWFLPLMKIIIFGGMTSTDYYLNTYLNDNKKQYYRLQVNLKDDDNIFAMDDFSEEHFSHLKERTDKFINENKDMLDELCEKLI